MGRTAPGSIGSDCSWCTRLADADGPVIPNLLLKSAIWLRSQLIGEALEKKALKSWNSPDLSEQHACAEAGQLWAVTSSELTIFAE